MYIDLNFVTNVYFVTKCNLVDLQEEKYQILLIISNLLFLFKMVKKLAPVN